MIVKTKLAEQVEQFQVGEVHYVGRRVLAFVNEQWIHVARIWYFTQPAMNTMTTSGLETVLLRLDYDRGEVFVDPAILRPYQRPERKEEAGT